MIVVGTIRSTMVTTVVALATILASELAVFLKMNETAGIVFVKRSVVGPI